jgi:uncharacterized membrane protein YhhN
VFAIGDWISRARDDQRLEYICKPAATAFVVLAAVLLDPVDPTQRTWFVAALVCCLAGDVFLMLDRFVPGLAAFLVGHLAFVGGFAAGEPDGASLAMGAAFVVLVLGALAAPIIGGVRRNEPALTVPVVAYFLVIATMVVFAIGSESGLAVAGAVTFAVSDSMIGFNRFVKPFAAASVAIMVTYHAALAMLTLALV